MNTKQNIPTPASTTESIFGFTPEEAREFETMPHIFHNTEEELLNQFSSEFDKTEMGKNKIAINNLIDKFIQDCKRGALK
jgi:hypothetical protein